MVIIIFCVLYFGFRKVEGEIFRLGMLLEDVQEKMDDSLYSQCSSSQIRLPTSPSLSACESVISSCSVLPEVTPQVLQFRDQILFSVTQGQSPLT